MQIQKLQIEEIICLFQVIVIHGFDATVAYGSQDFKFKNSRDYPVKIISSVENGICKVTVYGVKTDNEYDVTIENEIIKTIPKKTASGQTRICCGFLQSYKKKWRNYQKAENFS